MDIKAIDWHSLRALRDACRELLQPAVIDGAFAETRAAEAAWAEVQARSDFDVLKHRYSNPGVDNTWHERLVVVVRGLAACMNVAERLPKADSAFSDAWSTSWKRKPEELPVLGYAKELVGTADFLLLKYEGAKPAP